jgi:hypothetical protein
MAVKFFAPVGEDIEDVTPEQLSSLMFDLGPDYWAAGSGDAALRFTDGGAEGEIIFVIRDPIGVFVQFVEKNSHEQWVLSTGGDESETITIQQGGNPWQVPRAFFVDKNRAIDAITQFAKSGKKPTLGHWVPF